MANTEYDVIPMLHGDGVRIANALEQMVSMKNRGYILYGFHLNNNESDPSEKITYLEDAVGAVPAYMDYANGVFNYGSWKNAFFMPRKESDRPKVVPDGAVNFAFIGQFAETPRDTIFTTEYSIRTGMEAVYTLMNVDRAVPEVWGSKYDVRELLKACYYAVDKKTIDELPLNLKEKFGVDVLLKMIKNTDVEQLIRDSGLLK